MQTHRQIQRRLSAELDDYSSGLFDIDDVHDVFECERFEVQTIGRIVVGRDGFGIAVDHDRFVTRFVKRKRGVAAAIVELDALADAVGSRTENHDLRPICWLRFVFFFVRRVEIRCVGFELGATGVDALVNRNQSELFAVGAHFVFASFRQVGEAAIGERGFFECAQKIKWDVLKDGRSRVRTASGSDRIRNPNRSIRSHRYRSGF